MKKGTEKKSLSDKELILLIQQGDKYAFTVFHQRHNANLYLSAYHLLRNEDDAHDAVQELFSEVWQRSNRIDPTGNIKGYLYTILRNRILSAMSRSKHLSTYIDSCLNFEAKENTITEDTVLVRDLEQLLEKKVNQLPPKMREVHELSWKSNLSNKEIAERMDISEGTVKQHKHQAIRILRGKLQRLFSIFFI